MRAALLPGTTVGRYLLESRLGAGGMGVVWLARDQQLERRVALKLIAPELAMDQGFRARFAAEARAAAAVDHPHVLPVFEAGEADGVLYLAMRYVPGFDLGTLLAREGALPVGRAVELVGQVAAALDAAHAAGLVHRDVKPANVLVGPGDHAYLADFGLARAVAAGSGLTRRGQVAAGSADYLAPELLDGRPADPRSDVYALACLAFAALTDRPPFRRPDDVATLYAHVHEPPPAASSLRAYLSSALDAVLASGLAKDPQARYPSAGEFAWALAVAAGGGAGAAVPRTVIRRRPGSRRTALTLLGAGSFVTVGGAAVLLAAGLFRPSAATQSGSPGADRDGRIAFILEGATSRAARLVLVNSDGSAETVVGAGILPAPQAGSAPAWSLDGQNLAIATSGGIWSVVADGGGADQLTEFGHGPSLATDGQLAFWSCEDQPDEGRFRCAKPAIHIRQIDGRIRRVDEGSMPAWSPDGSTIAFLRHTQSVGSIWTMKADGSDQHRLPLDLATTEYFGVAWSPDGSQLAFATSDDSGGPGSIYITNRTGSTLRRATENPGGAYGPTWSPDGTRLAVLGDWGDGFGIHAIWLDESSIQSVRTIPRGEVTSVPSWGPAASGGLLSDAVPTPAQATAKPSASPVVLPREVDALSTTTQIYFIKEGPNSARSLTVMRPDGSAQTELLIDVGGGLLNDLDVSANGNVLAFATHKEVDGRKAIHLAASDGTGVREIVAAADGTATFSLSSDGERIAYKAAGLAGIRVIDSEGRDSAVLTQGPDDRDPSWGPDGTIAFIRSGSIWLIGPDGEAERLLVDLPSLNPARLDWAPDGSAISFFAEGADGGSIYTVSRTGSALSKLTDSGMDASPTWAPDGSLIAFQSQRDFDLEIYVMRPDGTGQARVTDTQDGALGPVWAPIPR